MSRSWEVAVVAGVLGGCGPAEPGPVAPSPGGAPASTAVGPAARPDESLARLQALDVFTVGKMLVQYPAEASGCYGPCPNSEGAVARANQDAAARLDAFTRRAAQAAEAAGAPGAKPAAGACEPATIDANIAALQALNVVEVGALLQSYKESHSGCYGVCPEDVETKRRQVCARAEKLAAIVAATAPRR